MTKTLQFKHRIVAGPSREELFDALRLLYEKRKVSFTLGCSGGVSDRHPSTPLTLQLVVKGITAEDSSGNSWMLKFYDENCIIGNKYLEGYYDTKRRVGWITHNS